MTDILPKNPYTKAVEAARATDKISIASILLSEREDTWKEGQDDTMEVLRPTLKDAGFFLGALHVIDQGENKTLGAVIDKIEQILKESE